jgi:hypothetical protein
MNADAQNSDNQNQANEDFEIFEMDIINQPTLQHDQ